MRVSRRALLAATGAGLALPLVGRAAPAAAAGTAEVIGLGPAVLGAPIVGAAVRGDRGYVVTRGLVPPVLGEIDLVSGRVIRNVELPTGQGGWGAAATDDTVYAGMYPVADVHRVDRAAGTVTSFPRLGNEQFAFDLAVAPNGVIYAGTYPGGRVYELDPTTNQVRNLGAAVTGLRYVRSIAVDPDGIVYAGTGTAARLVAIDPVTNSRTHVLPAELSGESFVYEVAVSPDLIVAGTEPAGRLAVLDRADPSRYTVVASGERTIDAIVIDGRIVYFTARPSGALYSYDVDAGRLTRLGVPSPGEETRGLFLRDGAVLGASGGGMWWRWANGSAIVVDLQQAGLRLGPEPPQSMSATGDGRVLVGGNFGLAVHDVRAGTVERVPMAGEAKSMTQVGDRTFLAVYPGAFVDTYDHRTGTVRRIGEIGGLSNRPRDMHWDEATGLLLIGTRNQYGHTGGALAVVDPGSGRIDRYDALVPDQAASAVTAHHGVAYLGTEIAADGVAPKATEAVVLAFDLATREARWTWTPIPGTTAYASLHWHGGLLYGVTNTGALFVGDPATRTVRATGQAAPGRVGKFAHALGRPTLATTEAVLWVDVDASTRAVATGLAAEWYNEAQVAADVRTGDLFTLRRRELVRLDLD